MKKEKCPRCNGLGYYAEHDLPTLHGEDGEYVNCPVKVQCEDCQGTGYPKENKTKLVPCACPKGGIRENSDGVERVCEDCGGSEWKSVPQ